VALAVSVVVLLIVTYVVPGIAAAVISVCVFLAFLTLWFALPLAKRSERRGADDTSGGG
jgi:hypothetical protein